MPLDCHWTKAPISRHDKSKLCRGRAWERRGKDENSLVERSEPSMALMMTGTTEASVLGEDDTLFGAPALSELFNEVICKVLVDREPPGAVGVSPEVGVMLKSAELELSVNTKGLEFFDEPTFVPLDIADWVFEIPMPVPVEENIEVTAIPVALEEIVTLFD